MKLQELENNQKLLLEQLKENHRQTLKTKFNNICLDFPDYSVKETGMKIKELRKKYNIIQNDLAVLLGVERACISHWEAGSKIIGTVYLYKIAKVFNISVDYLLGLEVS